MAKAREIPGLGPSLPFREAAAATIEIRSEELFAFAEGVLDTEDIERVHDMRVATRRLRAAMEVFAPCFPKREHRRALRAVKRLADALGARRDPDVAIEGLQRVEAALGAADRRGIESLVEELRSEQAQGNEVLAAALRELGESSLRERLLALAQEAREP